MENPFDNLPTLETERLILRKITWDDAEDIFAYASIEEVAKYVTWETHQTLADTRAYIEYALTRYENKQIAPWGIEYKENGKFIGTIDFISHHKEHRVAEIGYALSQDYWGKGITTEAAKEVLAFGFDRMDVVRIQARCFTDNKGSSRVMEKIGMSFEGTIRKMMFAKGKHQDIHMYSILKEEFADLRNNKQEQAKTI